MKIKVLEGWFWLPGHEFDHVPGLDDYIGVPALPGGEDGHAPLDQVQVSLQFELPQLRLHERPDLPDVLLPVLGEERGELALLQHPGGVVRLGELRHLQGVRPGGQVPGGVVR